MNVIITAHPLPSPLAALPQGERLRFGVEEMIIPPFLAVPPSAGATVVIERTATGVKLMIESPVPEQPTDVDDPNVHPI